MEALETPPIRFGSGSISQLPELLAELGVQRALLVTTRRGAAAAAGLPVAAVFDGVLPHVPIDSVRAAAEAAESARVDAIVGLGGGSAVDTAKAVAAHLYETTPQVTDRYKVIAVPTTYAGAEWTPYFGVLLEPGRKGGGMDDRARPVAAIYDPELTLELPMADTVGTAMNALAHCAEAYYHPATGPVAQGHADVGAAAISRSLPEVVAEPRSLDARSQLLEGAMHGALALAASGLCLAHAMAQGLGGRFGLPQGAMNAVCLPVALRFNEPEVPEAVARFARALDADDASDRCAALAALGGYGALRGFDIPVDELPSVADEIARRPGALANPRSAGPADVLDLLREAW